MSDRVVETDRLPIDRRTASRDQLPQRRATRVASWLLTIDHKRIAILYLLGVTFFFFLGGAAAVLFRLELMTPEADLVESETYNKLFTLHGVIMIFFFLIPAIPAVLGQLSCAADDRRPRPGVPAAQPAELVPVHDRRRCSRSG